MKGKSLIYILYIKVGSWQVFPLLVGKSSHFWLANPLFTPILCIKRFLLLVRFPRHDQIRPTSGERSRPESSAQRNQGLQRKRFGSCSGSAATILHGKVGKTSIRDMFLLFFFHFSAGNGDILRIDSFLDVFSHTTWNTQKHFSISSGELSN